MKEQGIEKLFIVIQAVDAHGLCQDDSGRDNEK